MKKQIEKQRKTEESSLIAIKAAEKRLFPSFNKVNDNLELAEKLSTQPILWYEKFDFYLSTDGFLVVSARDAEQAEILLTEHMKDNDIIVHAHVEKAPIVLIKNRLMYNRIDAECSVPISTLISSAVFCLSRSSVWNSKVSKPRAFYIFPSQIRKCDTAKGEWFPPGEYRVVGEENSLPDVPLVMGFGFLFRYTNNETFIPNDMTSKEIAVDKSHEFRVSDGVEGADHEFSSACNKVSDTTDSEIHNFSNITDQPAEKFLEEICSEEINDNENKDCSIEKCQKKEIDDIVNEEIQSIDTLSQHSPSKQILRGQRRKLKRIKDKYGDQDEEDKAIAMKVLGSEMPKRDISLQRAGQNLKLKESRIGNKTVTSTHKTIYTKRANSVSTTRCTQNFKEIQLEIPTQKEVNQSNEDADNLKFSVSQIQKFERNEHNASDNFCNNVQAFVVVAPFSAMQKMKYKIKLTPGNGKKLKTAKTCVDLLCKNRKQSKSDGDRFDDIEKKLIGCIPENKLIERMLGNAQASMPGMTKMLTEQRKKKKNKS